MIFHSHFFLFSLFRKIFISFHLALHGLSLCKLQLLKNPPYNAEPGFSPGLGKILWRGKAIHAIILDSSDHGLYCHRGMQRVKQLTTFLYFLMLNKHEIDCTVNSLIGISSPQNLTSRPLSLKLDNI